MTDVAVSALTRLERTKILRHLTELSPDDLWFRFGYPMRVAALESYVNRIDFASDRAIGIHNSERKLVGFIHAGITLATHSAEFGISVSPSYRRRGYASAMLRQALLDAPCFDLDEVYLYFRTTNLPMMQLARRFRFDIAVEGSETVASKRLQAILPGNRCLAADMRGPNAALGSCR